MKNLLFGIIMVIGGMSGKLAIRGTGSSTALIVIGGALTCFGLFQMSIKGEKPESGRATKKANGGGGQNRKRGRKK